MKNIWIISQLFYPDEASTGYVMTKIAETLTDIGQVNVICGSSDYQSKNLSSRDKLNEKKKTNPKQLEQYETDLKGLIIDKLKMIKIFYYPKQ